MMSFSADCGHPKGLGVLLRSGDANVWHGHHLPAPYALIGSGPQCNVRVPEESFAPSHVYLQAIDGRLFVCDLTNGRLLVVGGDSVHSAWLDLPSDFQLGRFSVRVAGVEEGESGGDSLTNQVMQSEETTDVNGRPSDVVLQLRSGKGAGPTVRSTRHVSLIGSGAQCKFCVRSPRVATVHCALVRTHRTVWLVDLGSGLETRINDQPVTLARLSSRTTLHVGDCAFDVQATGLSKAATLKIVSSARTGLVPLRLRGAFAARSEAPSPSPAPVVGLPAEVVRDVVGELGRSQDQALEKTRQMMLEILAHQERTVTSRVESLERQNEQLLNVLRTLIDEVRPPNGIPGPVATREAAETGLPPIPAPLATNQEVRESLQRLDPDVHEAWLRGQLQTIADGLRQENDRGLKKLLRKRPADADDALK